MESTLSKHDLQNLISQYAQIELISHHTHTEIFKVSDKIGHLSALKVAVSTEGIAALKRESGILEQLQHPNIVALIRNKTEQDPAHLVLEYLEGQTIDEIIPAGPGLFWQNMEPLFLQLCDAIEMAHDFGILHLDLKPRNILLARGPLGSDVVKVIDFGIGSSQMTSEGGLTSLGTPGFAAPEQILHKQKNTPVDHRADIYALGAILGFLLSGSRLFEGDTKDAILNNQLHERLIYPETSELARHSEVSAIVKKCLAFDPSSRYQMVADLSDAVISAG